MEAAVSNSHTTAIMQGNVGQFTPTFFRRIVESGGVPMIIFERRDRYPVVQFVNRAFSQRTGYAADDLRGSRWWVAHAGRGNEQALSQLRDAMCSERDSQIQLRSHCKDGSWFWSDLHLTPLVDNGGTPQYYVGVLRDISVERAQQDALVHDAQHDALTGLPNRRLLAERFEHAAASLHRRAQRFALGLIDLDDFKQVNDTLGHAAGDELLQILGTRLPRAVRAGDTVARLGGDEFSILIQSPQSYGSVTAVEARIRAVVARPMTVQGHELSVSCSIGVGLYLVDGADFDSLLEHADRRMYAQKLANRRTRSVAEGTDTVEFQVLLSPAAPHGSMARAPQSDCSTRRFSGARSA
jgi:diguanylate cyclase (GGDEF)-like protein/PAS domain S-box-containing protein